MSYMSATRCLIVPGLGNSTSRHWQTQWEVDRDDCQRVELGNWYNPDRGRWVKKLDLAISRQSEPVILVAHSLGCFAVAWWSVLAGADRWPCVAGALLVAPPDVERVSNLPVVKRFAPFPRCRLPFPTVVVASEDDPHCSITQARLMADRWSGSFLDIGVKGHINADSCLGAWPVGQSILDRLKAGEIGYHHSEFASQMERVITKEASWEEWPEAWMRRHDRPRSCQGLCPQRH